MFVLDVPGTGNHHEMPGLTEDSRGITAQFTGFPEAADPGPDNLTIGAMILLVFFIVMTVFSIFIFR
jgi:hypothetical protein